MNVITMPLEISLVFECMLPIATLPNASFAFCDSALRSGLRRFDAAGKCRFDHSPARRIVGIAISQSPYRVQMVRQHHNGVEAEWEPLPNLADSSAQRIDPIDEQTGTPIREIYGEEKASTRNNVAPVIRHWNKRWVSFPQPTLQVNLRRMGRVQRNPSPLGFGITSCPAACSPCWARPSATIDIPRRGREDRPSGAVSHPRADPSSSPREAKGLCPSARRF